MRHRPVNVILGDIGTVLDAYIEVARPKPTTRTDVMREALSIYLREQIPALTPAFRTKIERQAGLKLEQVLPGLSVAV